MQLYGTKMECPFGTLTLLATEEHLTHIALPNQGDDVLPPYTLDDQQPILVEALSQLSEYFSGHRSNFDLPLSPKGTKFQKQVWDKLQTIQCGTTWSYKDLALALNNPKAVRAVGAANGKNPIAIVIPCHRVIGSNGSLTGYAGGLNQKEWLLQHETKHFFSLQP